MKLCVIGNSHAGMLVQAWRETPGGLDLTFFARQGRGPEGVRLRGTELHAVRRDTRHALDKLGMPQSVDVAGFDGFVIVAMTATIFTLMPMLWDHAVHGWASAASNRPLVSRAALLASLRAGIEANIAHSMIAKIRRVGDAPILLVPQPNPCEDLLDGGARFPALRRVVARGEGPQAAALLRDAHAQVFHAMEGVTLLAQPEGTVAQDVLSARDYMRGAGRLNPEGRQPEEDMLHANARYGALVLGQISEHFGANR